MAMRGDGVLKVFVTGATGFVGKAMATRLLADGCGVTAWVRRPSAVLPDSVTQLVGEMGDLVAGDAAGVRPADLRTALNGTDVVVHAAARAHVMRERAPEPLADYRRVNVDGTLALARAAAQAGVRR